MRHLLAGAALAAIAIPAAAAANVVQQDERGFRIIHIVETDAAPDAVWRTLVEPSTYWNGSHSFSGDAANLSLDLAPGGCFCENAEKLSVEHARVIYSEPGVRLRMRGSLGPLQQDAVTGILTFVLRERETGGTTISLEYSVSGNFRGALASLAAAVDGVITEQGNRLGAAALGAPKRSDRTAPPVTDKALEKKDDELGDAFADTPDPQR